METVFAKSRWIWLPHACVNQYADFIEEFVWSGEGPVTLRISADTNYAVYVNGKYVYSGQYPDYPQYKIYDAFDIRPYCCRGNNRLAIRCSYVGEDTSTYAYAQAGLLFEVVSGPSVLAASGPSTHAREDRAYRSGRVEKVSPQLGFTYHYDACTEDDWLCSAGEGFAPCTVVEKNCALCERPIPRLRLREGSSLVCAQGEFWVKEEYPTAAETVYRSFMRHRTLAELGNPFRMETRLPSETGVRLASGASGVYVLADLCEETAGWISLDLEVPQDALVIVAFGEHLRDLRVRSFIDGRNFALTYRAHAGRNRWTERLRRLGCRYLQMFVFAPTVTLYDLNVLRTEYPAEPFYPDIADGLRRRIYQVGVHTLRCCMHEHYEDCPWREQALYAMDSRNQMLFGYAVFRDGGCYAQANLRLISHGLRSDGLLELCFPARVGVTIPSFSLYFVLAVAENYAQTGDAAFLREMCPTVESILRTFAAHIDASGLIPIFSGEGYWNFYEWKPGLDGGAIFRDFELPVQYDSCLNLLYRLAAMRWESARTAAGEEPDEEAPRRQERLRAAIERAFYDRARGAFAVTKKGGEAEGYSQLSTALAVVSGCMPEERDTMIRSLAEDRSLTEVTLGNKLWLYEAWLAGGESNLSLVLQDIDRTFGKMACQSSTLYETSDGADDFELAGSLCHGWSAVACYIYNTFARGKV